MPVWAEKWPNTKKYPEKEAFCITNGAYVVTFTQVKYKPDKAVIFNPGPHGLTNHLNYFPHFHLPVNASLEAGSHSIIADIYSTSQMFGKSGWPNSFILKVGGSLCIYLQYEPD